MWSSRTSIGVPAVGRLLPLTSDFKNIVWVRQVKILHMIPTHYDNSQVIET